MIKTIEGIYQDGQIHLTQLPQDISDRSQVLVTFLDPGKIDPTKLRQLIDQLETIAVIGQGFEELMLKDIGATNSSLSTNQRDVIYTGWQYKAVELVRYR